MSKNGHLFFRVPIHGIYMVWYVAFTYCIHGINHKGVKKSMKYNDELLSILGKVEPVEMPQWER